MRQLTISPSQSAGASQQPSGGSGSGSDFGPILQAASVKPAATQHPKQPQPAASGTARDDGAAAAAGAATRADVAPDISPSTLGGCGSGVAARATDPAIGVSGTSVSDASAGVWDVASNATGSALQSAVDPQAPTAGPTADDLDSAVAGQPSRLEASMPQLDRISTGQAGRALTQSKDARSAAASEEAGTDAGATSDFTTTLAPGSAAAAGQDARAALQALSAEIQTDTAKPIESAQSHAGADSALAAPADPASTATSSAGGAFGSLTTTYVPEGRAAVATPVGQPGFGQEFSERVVVWARGGVQSAQISLEPAGLGPVGVSIQVHGHEATLVFTAQHETTRSALEAALPRLREMFAECGMHLSDASVGGRAQPDRSAPDYSPSSSEPLTEGGADRLGAPSGEPAATARTAAALRLVDTYA